MSETPRLTGFDLAPEVITALEAVLPRMAERTVAAIIAEVPAYTDPFRGRMGQNIENAVQASLGAFLRLTTRGGTADSDTSLRAAVDGAYELGRGEARDGRSIDALLAAYRVGAREAWRELSTTAVGAGLSAQTIARFAELVFAYIDELSAASVSGHGDELATAGRVRQRYLDLLARQLLSGEDSETVSVTADTANWAPPQTLTAVLLPAAQIARMATLLTPAALRVAEDLPDMDPAEAWAAVLVPDVEGSRRTALLAALAGRSAVVGPSRPWVSVGDSYRRAVRARHLVTATRVVDTDEHLVELVLGADADAAADLQRRALAPLLGLGPTAGPRLVATLRSWLLHQGRRDAVAAELFVHPQTVRYRMNQIRQAYGNRLDDPRTILELTVAVGIPGEV
ncbi:MAG: helix-turn-helix domain-containing protein [Mycobacterium sp.]|nr:helix-turn-helix domain-containing protein [Mycobacterium sp.]